MELTNKLLEVGKWGIILVIVFEITALISGSVFMKEKITERNVQSSASANVLYFDELQKIKGKQ